MPSAELKQKRRSFREDALSVPNALTMMRIVLIPVVLFFLDGATPRMNFWAALVYVGCTVTDFFDGYLARRMGLVSITGQFLDPLADKLLVMSTLVFMSYQGRLPMLAVIAVNHPDMAFDFAVANLDMVNPLLEESTRASFVVGLAGGSNDPAMPGKIQAFADKNLPVSSRQGVKRALTSIAVRKAIADRLRPAVTKWVGK